MTRSCRKNNRTERPKTKETKEHCCSGLRGSLPWCYPVVPRGTPWYQVTISMAQAESQAQWRNGSPLRCVAHVAHVAHVHLQHPLRFPVFPKKSNVCQCKFIQKKQQKGHKKQKMTNVANYFSNTTALAESLVVFWLLMACEVIFQKNIGWGL